MATSYPFKIVTPRGTRYEGTVESVTVPGVTGEIGILAGHAPMVCATSKGTVTIYGGGNESFDVEEGILQVTGKEAILLADKAEPKS